MKGGESAENLSKKTSTVSSGSSACRVALGFIRSLFLQPNMILISYLMIVLYK